MGKRLLIVGLGLVLGIEVLAGLRLIAVIAINRTGGHLLLNGGESLPGRAFVCWPHQTDDVLPIGTLVEFHPTPAIATQLRGIAAAAVLAQPWTKRVAAQHGATVCWDTALRIDGVERAALPLAQPYHFALPEGCQILGEEEVLVLGDHPQSYDGRYFGVLRQQDIVATCAILIP